MANNCLQLWCSNSQRSQAQLSSIVEAPKGSHHRARNRSKTGFGIQKRPEAPPADSPTRPLCSRPAYCPTGLRGAGGRRASPLEWSGV